MSDSTPILLNERMGIAQAKKFHPLFATALSSAAPISIDGTRVQQIDGASLQLLVSLWLTAAEQGVACEWVGVSDWLRHAARLIGVAEVLRLAE